MTQRNRSLLDLAIGRVGVVKGAQAVEVIATWSIATRRRGHKLGSQDNGTLTAAIREYAEYWGMSERSAWRRHDLFRQAFPEEVSAERLASKLGAAVDERALTVAAGRLTLAA